MTEEIKIDRWQIEKETVNFSSRVWELRTRRYFHPKRKTSEDFYYISSPDWVVGVGRTVDKEIILVRQFRWGIDDFSLELPGGIVDPKEDPMEAGVREFKEETGYIGSDCVSLGTCLPNPAMLNNHCHFIFIDNMELSSSGTNWDQHEEIEVIALPESEVANWVKEGKLSHSLTLAALYRYLLCVKVKG